MKKGIIGLLGLLGVLGCEKEIDIDYRSVAPIYVVEASVNDEGMQARISQTQAMDRNETGSDVSGATVTISDGSGSQVALKYTKNGFYRAYNKGVAGREYRIDVEVDGHHFSSTSTMQHTPSINQFRFIWKKMLSERFLVAELRFQDIVNEQNWYFMHIYRNGLGYRWAVKKDDTDPNKELQQLFTIAMEGSGDKDLLREGDQLRIELRAIDQRAYDYLYSMQIMDNTGTNPIDNFTGGCLGYFSAYSQVTYECVFHPEEVEEEE